MPANVHFLIGRPGSGKTSCIFGALKDAMEEGRRAILVAPEQFTYEAERALSKALGGLVGLQVLSFERLAERVTGAREKPFLSGQGRRMVLRRVAHRHKGELTAFAAVAHRPGFAAEMDRLFGLCKRYGVTPEMLLKSAAGVEESDAALSAKLRDMALLFTHTQAYLDEHYIDTEDSLRALLSGMPGSFLSGAEIYIDDLEALSPQTAAILEGLMHHARELTISICMDPNPWARDARIFLPEQRACERLSELAHGLGCPVYVRRLGRERGRHGGAIKHLAWNLHAFPPEIYKEEALGITITGATNRTAEVEHMADSLLRLVRKGLRYRDIAVLASDLGVYAPAVRRAFLKRGIPVFYDAHRSMQGHPAVELLLAAARVAAGGLNRADVLRIAKTGLAGGAVPISREKIAAFENYCLSRGILGGGRLQNPFPEEEVEAEEVRAMLVLPLLQLREVFQQSPRAAEKTIALYQYMEGLAVQLQLTELVKDLREQGRYALMQEHAQVWDILMELFSQLHAILGEESMSRREYLAVLTEAVSAYHVGMIPVTADQVLFGDVERTRSRAGKALFVLGCNEGMLPRPRMDDEVLDDRELSTIRKLGVAPWEETAVKAMGDQLDLYKALCKAESEIHFSFSYSDGRRELQPATLMDRLRLLFPKLNEQTAGADLSGAGLPAASLSAASPPAVSLPESENGGFGLLMGHLGERDNPLYAGLREYYICRESYAKRLRRAESFMHTPAVPSVLGEAQAKRLYGEKLYTTVSRLETFRTCPFRHFVQYGLQAKPRQEFKEKRADIGSFSHMALEAFLRLAEERGIVLMEMTKAQAEALLNEALPLCLEGYQDGMLLATARTRMLSTIWMDAVRATATAMVEGLQAGSFRPARVEAHFGPGEELPAVESSPAVIMGKIDRIDIAPCPGGEGYYVRVVDYKTGAAELNYSDIADGLSLQLAIYLHAAAQAGGTPAGMVYQPVLVPVAEEGEESKAARKLRVSGMLLEEEEALRATAGQDTPLREVAKSTLLSGEQMERLLSHALRRAGEIAGELQKGSIAAAPVRMGRSSACAYCDYKGVCRFDVRFRGCHVRRVKKHSAESFFAAEAREGSGPRGKGGGEA